MKLINEGKIKISPEILERFGLLNLCETFSCKPSELDNESIIDIEIIKAILKGRSKIYEK